jgi:hypothetical protein
VTCRPIARERLGKQARDKYAANSRVDPFLSNDSVNTSRGNEYAGNNRITSVAMQRRCKYNSRIGVVRGVFYVVRLYPLLGNGCVFCAVVRPKTIQGEANNNCQFCRKSKVSRRPDQNGASQN